MELPGRHDQLFMRPFCTCGVSCQGIWGNEHRWRGNMVLTVCNKTVPFDLGQQIKKHFGLLNIRWISDVVLVWFLDNVQYQKRKNTAQLSVATFYLFIYFYFTRMIFLKIKLLFGHNCEFVSKCLMKWGCMRHLQAVSILPVPSSQ